MRPILTSGKKLVCRDGQVFESVNGELYPFDADVYVHHFSSDLVGYQSEKGDYKVFEKDGLLGIVKADSPVQGLMRIDLFEDIGGAYFPIISTPDKSYSRRADGRVEEVTVYKDRSAGVVVENRRGKIRKE